MRNSTTTIVRRLTSAAVSMTLAKNGRFWPSVDSAKAGFARSGIVAPNVITNGAIAQLMCSPNRLRTRQNLDQNGISVWVIAFWMTYGMSVTPHAQRRTWMYCSAIVRQ
jgi:hypothetical protein